jgi:hypothetical protein
LWGTLCSTSCHRGRSAELKRHIASDLKEIAWPKFRTASNSFEPFDAATSEIAAVQGGWRDFRIATSALNASIRAAKKLAAGDCRGSRETVVEAMR